MSAVAIEERKITARDVSGQRIFSMQRPASGESVGELVRKLVGKLGLASEDKKGRPTVYRAYLDREGRHLHGSELVSDSLMPDDALTIMPDVQAG